MISVLNNYYSSSEQVEDKSLLGYLRYFTSRDESVPINMVDDTKQPTFIFVHTNTVHHVPMEQVQEIVSYYKKHKFETLTRKTSMFNIVISNKIFYRILSCKHNYI